jgi:hypothetical protein
MAVAVVVAVAPLAVTVCVVRRLRVVVVFVVRVIPDVVPARATAAAVLLLLLDDEVVRGLPPRPQYHVEPGELVHLQMGERVEECGAVR